MDLFMPFIFGHFQLSKEKITILNCLICKNMGLIASQLANHICQIVDYLCQTSNLNTNMSTKYQYLYL